jgi:hypothetical protein
MSPAQAQEAALELGACACVGLRLYGFDAVAEELGLAPGAA